MYQCKDIAEEVNNYIEGDLPIGKRIGLFFHILMCSCCRNYMQQIRATISVITVSRPQEKTSIDLKVLAKQLHDQCEKHNH